MTPAQVAHIMALAKECGAITYTHRSSPHEAAVSFGPIAWAKFVEAALLAPQQTEMVDMVPPATSRDRWMHEQGRVAEREAVCARIKAADNAGAENDYMLDSDDCISVIRGTWKGPMLNDQPSAPTGKDSLAVEPDERAEFEAWINRGERSPLTVKDDRGGYLDTPTHFRWTGWQARASKGTK